MPSKELVSHKNKIDALLTRIDNYAKSDADPDLQGDLTRYACVQVSGYLEKAMLYILYEYSKKNSDPRMQKFTYSRLWRFTNATTGWGTTYAWSFGDGGTSAAQDTSNLFVNMGAYAVTLIGTDGRGCKDTFTKTVFVDSSAKISMTESDSVICKGGQVTFQGVYTDIGLTATHWTFGDGSGYDNTNPIPHSFEAIGDLTVTLTVTYRSCPTATASHNVRVYPNPDIYLGPDTAICPGGDLIQLYDRLNSGNTAASWLWNTGEVTPLILATKPGYYSATVTIFGCIATDTVWVANDCYVSYPNIFTPNGDGLNDYFFPRNLLTRGLIDFKMDIYNRWGQLIYQTKNIEGQGWDGTFNNEHQPEGVYIYQITATFKDGQKESKTGNLTLIR